MNINKTLSVKRRLLMTSVATAGTLILLLSLFIYTVLVSDYKELETDLANRNIQRAVESYNLINENYDRKSLDWSEWDDTYQFVKEGDGAYIASNLASSTLGNLQIDEMAFYDIDGKLKYATASPETIVKEPDFPRDMEGFITDNPNIVSSLKSNKLSSGLYRTDDGVMLYSARTITKSDGTGNAGTLYFGKYIQEWLAPEISKVVQLPVRLEITPIHSVDKENPLTIDSKEQKVYGHIWMPTVNPTDEVLMEVEMDRSVWSQGISSMYYLLIVAVVVSTVIGVINYLVLRKMLLGDLLAFGSEVANVTKTPGAGFIQKKGLNIEIDELRDSINFLINSINESKKETENKIAELDKMNKLMIGREVKMIEIKKESDELKKTLNNNG